MSIVEQPIKSVEPQRTDELARAIEPPTSSEPRDPSSGADTLDPAAGIRRRLQASIIAAVDRLDDGPLGEIDALSLAPALVRSAVSIGNQPATVLQVGTDYATGLFASSCAAISRAFGVPTEGQKLSKDKRFTDQAWTDHPGFFWVRENLALIERATDALVDAADVTPGNATRHDLSPRA